MFQTEDFLKAFLPHRGDAIVLVAFGAGLTWAAACIRW